MNATQIEQLINRVYGNISIEHPNVTREMVRERIIARRTEIEQAGDEDLDDESWDDVPKPE